MNRQSRFLSFAFALIFIPIYFADSAPDSFTCKPLPFYRFRVDQRQRYQLNRLAAAGPLMVRLIYFIPSDRPFRAEVPAQMEAFIKETQAFYADQMQATAMDGKPLPLKPTPPGRRSSAVSTDGFPTANTSVETQAAMLRRGLMRNFR